MRKICDCNQNMLISNKTQRLKAAFYGFDSNNIKKNICHREKYRENEDYSF